MKTKQEIENEVGQTLNSLDSLQQLEANEFLYTKIAQRINNGRTIPLHYNRVMLRLAAVLILFIGINCASYYIIKQRGQATGTKITTGADAFVNAYNLNTNLDSY